MGGFVEIIPTGRLARCEACNWLILDSGCRCTGHAWPWAVARKVEQKMETKLTGDPDFDELLQECIKTLEIKGGDYTVGAGDKDRLYNFRTAAAGFDITPEQALGVYLFKHWTAVQRFCKEGQVESEPIRGRLVDVINYCLLLHKMILERDRGKL